MDREYIERRIKEVLARDFMLGMRPADIDSNISFFDKVGMDSIQVLELVVGLEDEFGIRLEDEDLNIELFGTVASMARYIERKMAGEMVKPFFG